MPDLHIRIEVTSGTNLAQAVAELRQRDNGFPDLCDSDGGTWWHKPPDRARALICRTLSRHGLMGRLSLAEHVAGTEWDAPPPPKWSGFTAQSTAQRKR
jgi:hypothetical protein